MTNPEYAQTNRGISNVNLEIKCSEHTYHRKNMIINLLEIQTLGGNKDLHETAQQTCSIFIFVRSK